MLGPLATLDPAQSSSPVIYIVHVEPSSIEFAPVIYTVHVEPSSIEVKRHSCQPVTWRATSVEASYTEARFHAPKAKLILWPEDGRPPSKTACFLRDVFAPCHEPPRTLRDLVRQGLVDAPATMCLGEQGVIR